MNFSSPAEALKGNTYPGRGILLGKSSCGRFGIAAYFIMGRSANSRNRVFVPTDDGIRTQALDPTKLTDPSLIIYHPVRATDNAVVVTNGDQTDTIADFLRRGAGFEDALCTRTFEPDAPNYTPRVSGLITLGSRFRYELSILKTQNGDPSTVCRYFFRYDSPAAGIGHLLHTYRCDGSPIPSFEGEPKTVSLCGDIDTLTASLWDALDPGNKVSLYTAFFSLDGGENQTRIQNLYK